MKKTIVALGVCETGKFSRLRLHWNAAAHALGAVFMILAPFHGTGCVLTTSAMKSWVGHPTDELIAKWGVPDSSMLLDSGGKVLTWKTVWNDGPNIYTCRKSFTVNANGAVERWSYSGCPALSLVGGSSGSVANAEMPRGRATVRDASTDSSQQKLTVADLHRAYARIAPEQQSDIQKLIDEGSLNPNGFTVEEFVDAIDRTDSLSGRSKGAASRVATALASATTLAPERKPEGASIAKAVEASDQALAERCGWEYVDRLKELKLAQEDHLKAAGLTFNDQTKIAGKLLMGSTSGSERYITTIGLSFADERKLREQFLSLIRATSDNLRQGDDSTLATHSLFYNAYLQEGALVILTGGCKGNRVSESSSR